MGGIIPCNSTDCQVNLFVSAFQQLLKRVIQRKFSRKTIFLSFSRPLEEPNTHKQADPRHADDDQGSQHDDQSVNQGGFDLGLSSYFHDPV